MTQYIMTTQSKDRTGIVAALTSCLAKHEGFINELAQFGTPDSDRFYSRIDFTIDEASISNFKRDIGKIAEDLSLNTKVIEKARKVKTLLMVSKFDHCLADLLYKTRTDSLPIEITGIASNHDVARHHAESAGIAYHHIPITKATKPQAEAMLKELIESTGTELIVLARYMQILSDEVCQKYSGRIINIHHSFLPSFKGAKPYHRAYDLGVKLIGATAHYVTADLDEGPIIEQRVQRVNHTMTPDKLIAIGRDVEAQALGHAVKLHAEHRAFLNGGRTVVLP